jgi:uncharacterized protein YbjQ (UPF0145 family)
LFSSKYIKSFIRKKSFSCRRYKGYPKYSVNLLYNLGVLMKRSMTTTTFTLEGYKITKNLGLVRGITVRSRSIFGTIGGSLQTLIGGNITLFTDLCEKTREEAFEMMLRHAEDMGANAVVGVRYDANEVMNGVTEVLCYGTAVLAE